MSDQSTTTEQYDGFGDAAVIKTTQAGKLVVQVASSEAACWAVGEIGETAGRLFRIDGKGHGFQVAADAATIAGLKARGYSKRDIARELEHVYLYVTEVTPAAVVETPVAEARPQVCAACGMAPTSSMCVMSDDGEGAHDIVDALPPLSTDDAAFLMRYAVHMEQGAMER